MNVPIRALGIATSIFWILLIAFMSLSAYSFKDLNFGLGEPQFATTPDGQLLFSLPLYINNGGHSSLKEFYLMTTFSDAEGVEISRANTSVPFIPRGENVTIVHNVTLNMNSVLGNAEQYLFNDNELTASVTAELTLAELLPAQISTNFTFPWGAPFYNFALGQPSLSRFDLTHGTVSVSISFENHAAFDLAGNIRVELIDSVGSLLSESETAFYAPQYSAYEDDLEFSVPLSAESLSAARNGYFNVYFSTPIFEYGPMVIPYG